MVYVRGRICQAMKEEKWKQRVHKGRLEESAKETRIQLKIASFAPHSMTMTETAQPKPCNPKLS